MATREKKPRSVNSDSPTPSLGGGSDSAPSTPTSKGKGSRASLSRQKSKQLQSATNEDSVQSTDDIADATAQDPANTSGGSASKSSASNSRTTRATKDEPVEKATSSKDKEKDEPKDSKSKDSKLATRKTVTKKMKPISGGGSKAKTTVTALKKTTLMKRKTRPIVGKPVLGKKVIARKQINAKGKKEVTVTVKDDDNKSTASLRNGKPRATTDSPVSKRKSIVPKDKGSPKSSSTPDPVTVKMERRRSDSVSKCSDVTDASLMDTSSCKDDDDKKDDTSLSEIKRELMEENETKTKILDKMAETFNERKTPTVATSKDDKKVRRSARQRKSTARDKDDFVTPKLKAPVDIKSEPMDTDEADAAPLTIDTESPAKDAPSAETEKDSSLSPELISEGVSEISVKEFYSEPAFLENNLGIEKDPKLGEIVQVQEKIKLDKGSDSAVTANGSTSVKEEVKPVVIKEEKIEVEDVKHDKLESVKMDCETMGVEKMKEIIGIVEPSKVQSISPPVVVIPKDEFSGNESPASDRSNDKDVLASICSKVESMLKKNDSRSDSDGERPNKQNTPKAKATGKEPKPKARNVKDKGKEDEKAKEEKLRQEKLRVEEKVREEKLRAEILKQEEEKRLLEEKLIQEEKVKYEQEQEVKSPLTSTLPLETVGKEESPKPVEEVISVVEKILPSTKVTTLSLTSADSHLVLSITSSESIDIVEQPEPEANKSDAIVKNTITLENLPAITLLKKDPTYVKDISKDEIVQPKAELEILPIKEAVVVKEEMLMEVDSEKPMQIISKSENSAAAVTITTVTAEADKSPLSIIKIQTEEDSIVNPVVFKETLVETVEVKAVEPVINREPIKEVPHLEETKTVEIISPCVTDVLPVAEPSNDPATSPMVLDESDDIAKQKECHLMHLGLLTLQAASAEKQRRKELVLQKPSSTGAGGGGSGSGYSSSSSSGKGSKSSRNSETTGTLKTVIKLNRGEKRKPRLPLKMTLQKGKGKGAEKDANGSGGNGETAFYIIQNETDHQNQSLTDSAGAAAQGRKAHSRSHTTAVHQQQAHVVNIRGPELLPSATPISGTNFADSMYQISTTSSRLDSYEPSHGQNLDEASSSQKEDAISSKDKPAKLASHVFENPSQAASIDGVTLTEVVAEAAPKEAVQKALVIPEKASSFNVHPERLCQDQCFYCGGKFGLYDTPCHIAAMKSSERQQKILASEVKIKIDSCLCDACFRHVDRKANCPSYRKKTEAKSLSSLAKIQSSVDVPHEEKQSQDELMANTSDVGVDSVTIAAPESQETSVHPTTIEDLEIIDDRMQGSCHVRNCGASASHTIRRKWLIKMKKTISKILEINLEQTNAVSNLIPICDGHYELISHLMICAMCKRRLPKNHIYYIVNEIPQLERLIQEQGIAMKLGNSTLVVCKLCRYYANLLLKPPDAKSQKAQFIKNYNRRLLQFYERENEQQELVVVSTVVEPTRIVTNPDIVISDGEEEPIEVVSVVESVSLQRLSRHVRKSTDLTIIDGNCSQMSDLEEVTITPTPKLPTAANISGNSSIILDPDVSVEQPASAEKRRKDDGLDMTKALKANPNISMRELFPGEEELGIHINIPFSTASARTPEGWAKTSTTLQYDDSTRALWEELQKPYGNQSSFLRHLVLLEKYFRNGDLILSPQAKNSAATYSEAVQNRLRSFDNVPTPPPATIIDKTSILQQLGNAPITVTAAAKSRTKSSTEPVSLLKSNNPHLVSATSVGESSASLKRKLSTDAKAKPTGGRSEVNPASKVIKLDETIVLPGSKAPSLVPPELISINSTQNVTITTIPASKPQASSLHQSQPSQHQQQQQQLQQQLQQHQQQQHQQQQQQQQQQSLLQPQQSLLQPQPHNRKSPGSSGAREIIKLPDQLTEAERRETSKPWRPTLIPITPGSSEAIKAGPLYQTADGRRLPKLVQVMSGGKPYHISINDYNRMCILRREKLLQQQQQILQHQIHQHQKRLQQQSPPNLSNAPKAPNVKLPENAISSAKMVQIPNQILEQNSLIPILNSSNSSTNNNSNQGLLKSNGPSSELQQLIKTRKPSSNPSMVPPVTSSAAFFKNTMAMNVTASKPISLPNSTSVFSMPVANQQQSQQHPQHPANTNPSPAASLPAIPSQLDQLIKSNNQFLSSFVSQSQLSAMVAAAAAAAANSTTPMIGGTSGGSILMDNSAVQLLSKIPKSLTVIPQQKQRSLSRVSSNEDQSSA